MIFERRRKINIDVKILTICINWKAFALQCDFRIRFAKSRTLATGMQQHLRDNMADDSFARASFQNFLWPFGRAGRVVRWDLRGLFQLRRPVWPCGSAGKYVSTMSRGSSWLTVFSSSRWRIVVRRSFTVSARSQGIILTSVVWPAHFCISNSSHLQF